MACPGEQLRALFTSDQPFTYLHVYLRHNVVERLAVDSGLLDAGRTVTLIDPMCAHDPFIEFVCRQMVREMSHDDTYRFRDIGRREPRHATTPTAYRSQVLGDRVGFCGTHGGNDRPDDEASAAD